MQDIQYVHTQLKLYLFNHFCLMRFSHLLLARSLCHMDFSLALTMCSSDNLLSV